MIRVDAGMPTSRFVELIGVPERSYLRWQAKARTAQLSKGPWPQPAREAARELVTHPCAGQTRVGAQEDLGDDPS